MSEHELSEKLESFIENSKQEASNHGSNQSSNRGDTPEGEEDDLIVTTMEIHLHHVWNGVITYMDLTI